MSRNLIVVDDDKALLHLLDDYMSRHGWAVRVAADAAEGLRLCRQQAPDVVLCDVGLPDVSGFEFARALRRDPRTAGSAVVFFTGSRNDPEDIERELDGGAQGYIAKPADLRLLQAKLEAVAKVAGRS